MKHDISAPGRPERSPAQASLRPPSEPCVKVSLHTAQAFLRSASAEVIRQSGFCALIAFAIRICSLLTLCRMETQSSDFQWRLLVEDPPINLADQSSFAFPPGRRFYRFSCKERPDRRGHIPSSTERPWLSTSLPRLSSNRLASSSTRNNGRRLAHDRCPQSRNPLVGECRGCSRPVGHLSQQDFQTITNVIRSDTSDSIPTAIRATEAKMTCVVRMA